MIKAAVYSDLQASEGSERCFSNPDVPLQRYRVDLFYKKLLEIYRSHGCNALWDLGDTTDDRSSIPIPALNSVYAGIRLFPKKDENIKLIGNHEQYTRNAEIDAGCVFEDTFQVVRGVKIFQLEGIAVICISYPASYSELAGIVDSAILKHRRQPIVVLAHCDVAGARVKNGTLLNGLPCSAFKSSTLTLLGHIHLPQKLGTDEIYYVGSPFQQNFGEAGEDKRVAIVTLDSGTVALDWIPMTGFPTYANVSWTDFKHNFSDMSENRYEVELATSSETEEFLKHKFSGRTSFTYKNTSSNSQELEKMPTSQVWSLEESIKLWVKKHSPKDNGFELSDSELVDIGLQLVHLP